MRHTDISMTHTAWFVRDVNKRHDLEDSQTLLIDELY